MTRTVLLASISAGLTISGTVQAITATQAYSTTLTASGGAGGYKFAIAGSLPLGVTFTDNSNGTATIAGTAPSGSGGTYPVTVSVSDSARNYRTITYNLVVNELPLTLTGQATHVTSGLAYSFSYTISGGVSPYSCSLASGVLPAGLTLSAAGTISGTTTQSGTFPIVVLLTDSKGKKITLSDSLSVGFGTLTITGAFTATASIGIAYSSTISISGGQTPYLNLRSISGAIPSGLSLTLSGSNITLSGTPSGIATFNFTVAVDSSDGQTAYSAQTITVAADPIALSIYNKIATAAGGVGEYWDLTESNGTRAGKANGAFPLSMAGTNSTETGPRGGTDIAWGASTNTQYLYTNRTVNDALDVPASSPGPQSYCLFGLVKFHSTSGSQSIAGTYRGAAAPNGGYILWTDSATSNQIDVVSGNSPTNSWITAGLSIPDTTNWHFYAIWQDSADGKLRIAIDGGTPAVSSASCTIPQSNIRFSIGSADGSFAANVGCSRFGYMKGHFLTSAEQTWLLNSRQGRNWSEIKTLSGH